VKQLLSIYEFQKLGAIVNGICLSILILLYTLLIKNENSGALVILIGALITTVISLILAFLLTRRSERPLLESGAKYWNARGITISLSISFACTLVGILAIAAFSNRDTATGMIVVLSYYFGTNLGNLIKIAFRFKKV
jgi:amino acid permease